MSQKNPLNEFQYLPFEGPGVGLSFRSDFCSSSITATQREKQHSSWSEKHKMKPKVFPSWIAKRLLWNNYTTVVFEDLLVQTRFKLHPFELDWCWWFKDHSWDWTVCFSAHSHLMNRIGASWPGVSKTTVVDLDFLSVNWDCS